MKTLRRLLPALLLLTARLSPQEPPARGNEHGIGPLPAKRDKAAEDQIARVFEASRADSKLPHLTRISVRLSLSQTVCTIAVAGKLPPFLPPPAKGMNGSFNVGFPVNHMSGFYSTQRPEFVTDEMKRDASLNEAPARYSVVVWRTGGDNGESTYWVGVQLYWSASREFFIRHFTDDVEYRNDWKKWIAPECRGN